MNMIRTAFKCALLNVCNATLKIFFVIFIKWECCNALS